MHNAPAVSYPVGRSRFHAQILILAFLGGLVTWLAWAAVVDAADWRLGLGLVLVAVTGGAAYWGWQKTLSGTLCWDGQTWRVDFDGADPGRGASFTGRLAVRLDLQAVLLVRLRHESGCVSWFWLEPGGDVMRWQALRRAVHAVEARPVALSNGAAP